MEMKKSGCSNTSSRVRNIVQLGLLSALTFVAAWAIHIPYGNGGVVHLGDSMIFLTAILFGRRQAAISGALGMALFDIMSGFVAWAPYTLVIKAVMGLITGTVAYSGGSKGANTVKNIAGMILAGIWMVAGYYAAEGIMLSNWTVPLAWIPGNIIQFSAGAAIAVIVIAAIKRTNYFKNI